MAEVRIDKERCKSCGFCVEVCPQGVLQMSEGLNARGVHFAVMTDGAECTGCMHCAIMCPDVAIEVYR